MAGAIVQFKAAVCDVPTSTLVVVMTSPPTAGNWLLCIASHYQNNPSANTGWTRYYNQDGVFEDGTAGFYKLAGAGESATQSVFTGVNEGMGCIWEISGLSGVFGTDFQQSQSGADQAASPVLTTTSFNVSNANSMVFGLAGGAVSTGATAAAPTVATGQTNDTSLVDNAGLHRHAGEQFFHQFFPTNGSAVQYTATFGVNQIEGFYGIVVMNWTGTGQALTGRARCQVKARAGGGFKFALVGRVKAKVAGRLFYGSILQVLARTRARAKGKAKLLNGVLLSGRSRTRVKGKTRLAGTLTLAGRTRVEIKLRGFGTQALRGVIRVSVKARTKFSSFRGFAPTVRNIIGTIWPDRQ